MYKERPVKLKLKAFFLIFIFAAISQTGKALKICNGFHLFQSEMV